MRLFVAVAIPAQVAAELEAAVAPLRSSWPGLRWTGRDAWHLTLAFLGEVEETIAAGLPVELAGAAVRHPPLALSLAGSGAFPGADRARVLWTGVQQEGLKKLADAVANAARAAKAPPVEGGEGAYNAGAPPVGDRKFQGHLTLARCRAPVDVRSLVADLADYAGSRWTAEEIYLIRSRPDSRPRYETLGSWPLRAPSRPA